MPLSLPHAHLCAGTAAGSEASCQYMSWAKYMCVASSDEAQRVRKGASIPASCLKPLERAVESGVAAMHHSSATHTVLFAFLPPSASHQSMYGCANTVRSIISLRIALQSFT
jgi:hypothetical protein